MRKLVEIGTLLLMTVSIFLPQLSSAQAPEKMSYQAVVRNSSNVLVTSTAIGMQISILQGSTSGIAVYIETQTPTTNANGLVNLEIGNGTVVSGDFANIDWSTSEYYIKTETDPAGGTNYSITGTSQLLSVPYALHAKNVKTYKLGDFAHGGIVFWVDETGQHGLVCAKTDQSTGVRWHAGTSGVTRATGNGPFSGELNTSIIISSHVAIGDDGSNYAAQICNDLQITEGGKTYGDWYLPSKDELNLLYLNQAIINATAALNGGSDFANSDYWSSTEVSSTYAWLQYFTTGYQYNVVSKGYGGKVRAVRAF